MFVSLREAVEMRSLLSSLSESKRRIAWLQKRLEVQAAFAPNTLTRGVDTARQSGEAVKSALAASTLKEGEYAFYAVTGSGQNLTVQAL